MWDGVVLVGAGIQLVTFVGGMVLLLVRLGIWGRRLDDAVNSLKAQYTEFEIESRARDERIMQRLNGHADRLTRVETTLGHIRGRLDRRDSG